ncbi:H-NS histone family protein [Bradyrhizobium sp. BRP22]|nr:H-NS histone family protein [Bradyrhizobium sp. BRP22]
MPLVIVPLAGEGAAIGQLQITLRALQSLDRGLLVQAQHNGLRGRGDVEANNIGGFGRKVRVGALAPGLASREVNLVAAQEPPDILDVKPKYQNPDQPSQTWTGRGKQPRWLAAQLKLGKHIDDFKVPPRIESRDAARPPQPGDERA